MRKFLIHNIKTDAFFGYEYSNNYISGASLNWYSEPNALSESELINSIKDLFKKIPSHNINNYTVCEVNFKLRIKLGERKIETVYIIEEIPMIYYLNYLKINNADAE